MSVESRYTLMQDKKGALWDLALYIPTLIALVSVAVKLWFSGDQAFTYLVLFATTIVFLIGFNRITKTRLMILSSAPTALTVSKKNVQITLRNSSVVDLVKDVKYFADFSGKSFGLTGVDLSGRKLQFVFHKGQFADGKSFAAIRSELGIFK